MKKILTTLLSFSALTIGAKNTPMEMFQVSSLRNVLYCDAGFTDTPDTLRVARGENATAQFVLTSSNSIADLQVSVGQKGLGEVSTGWVHDVVNKNPTIGADDMISTPDSLYPDPIIDDDTENLTPDSHKTLWVDVAIPRDAKPGLHKVNVMVTGTQDGTAVKVKKTFCIQVYPVTLPEEQKLKVVNWYDSESTKRISSDPKSVTPERYLELLQKFAEIAAKYGQNCWLIGEKPEMKLNSDSTDFYLDFTYFDKVVDMFIKHGNLKYFCNSHIGGRNSGEWNDEMYFHIYTVQNKKLVHDFVPCSDPRLEHYIQHYYTQIEEHFRQKGWLDICYQHVADEPATMGTDSQKSWSKVAGMIKKAAPLLKTIDACYDILENQDVSVVQLAANIATMPPVPEGCERWMYTCCVPRENYANRFVQLPLIKTRILHWINYKYGEAGYLHWGLNFYRHATDPLHDVTPYGAWYPGGDCYIVYPGREKVYPSIRLCGMRDGIRDYDLLCMVEAICPMKAKEWSDSIVLGPDKYDTDIAHFNRIRREMLEFLSNNNSHCCSR